MRARARWALALLPVLVAAGVGIAARAGGIRDPRLAVTVSALRGDWLLAAGGLLALLAGVGLVAVSRRDARWRQRLTAQDEAHARDRRRLLARLDHELKNPLTVMRAAVANASGEASDTDRQQGLRSIQEQVLRLSRLTEALRTLADVETGSVARRPVEVAVLLEEAVEIARTSRARSGCGSPSTCRTRRGRCPRSPGTGNCCPWWCATCWTTPSSTPRRADASRCARGRQPRAC